MPDETSGSAHKAGLFDIRNIIGALMAVYGVILTLAGLLGEQAQVRDDELPFGVRDIAGVGLVTDHTLNYARNWTTVHNTL